LLSVLGRLKKIIDCHWKAVSFTDLFFEELLEEGGFEGSTILLNLFKDPVSIDVLKLRGRIRFRRNSDHGNDTLS
jgi:hypothetical protein